MSEETQNQAPEVTADQTAKPEMPKYDVTMEDVGVLKKKISVTVPRSRIDEKFNEMFGEISTSAVVPGFRQGHAPRRLIEKRFGKEISGDVRNALVGEAIGQVAEQQKIHTIGEPQLELEKIEVPDTGDLSFSFVVEVAPDFDLPETKGIKVQRPTITVNDAKIDEALDNVRRNEARYEITEEPAGKGDIALVGVKISGEGIEAVDRPGLTLRVAPGQVEGLPLLDLDEKLAGKKVGDTVTLTTKGPDAHPTEAWRGKDITVEITVSQIRRTVLPEINEEYAKGMGFESLQQLRDQVAKRLEAHIKGEVQQAMRSQICKYLLDTVKFDLPEGVVERHAIDLLKRRTIELMNKGIPQEKISEHLSEMHSAAKDQAKDDMRLSFILSKFVEQQKITITEGELNSAVAEMAQMYNRRPERMRSEMEADGSLGLLADRLHEGKALDMLLEQAEITDVEEVAKADEQADAAEGEKKPKAAKQKKEKKADKE
ncbi:MAG: trigger factor [Planctomycetaceae bacterium]|nr:MAG: trigger factor [Planctomycetaceae bacterium]